MASQVINNERIDYIMVSFSEYVEHCCSQISNRLINKVYLRVFALFYFAKDDVYNFLSVSIKSS